MQVNFNFSVNIDDKIISFFKRIFTMRKIFFAIMIALITVALNASVPVTFTPGTTIIASDVNSNFDALDTRITTLEGIWSTDSTNVYRQTGNVGIGTSSPGYKLDVNRNINLREISFIADNSTWRSLNYNMVQGSGGGAAYVMCSTHHSTTAGQVAMYLIRAPTSSTSSITSVYIGGTLNIFSFQNNNGVLEVKGWDGSIALSVNASCSVISMGNN